MSTDSTSHDCITKTLMPRQKVRDILKVDGKWWIMDRNMYFLAVVFCPWCGTRLP